MDSFYDLFIDPPIDTVAQHPQLPLLIGAVLVTLTAVVGVVYTLRTRSPLFAWAAVCGATLLPFVVEPFGDWFIAVWYPTNLDIAARPFNRPIPWFAVMFYVTFTPLVTTAAYHVAQRGRSARRLLGLVALFAVLEVPMEMLGSQWNWMHYYGNHAMVFDVPVYCLIQNAGWLAIIAMVLAWQLPRTHGWRWALVPFTIAFSLPVFALVTTWPAYLAIHLEAGPEIGWTAGIVATLLNAAAVVAAAYSKPLQRLRAEASRVDAAGERLEVAVP